MSDITKCEAISNKDGKEISCPFKDKCYRYTAPKSDYWQSMFEELPGEFVENNLGEEIFECNYYWDNKGYRKC